MLDKRLDGINSFVFCEDETLIFPRRDGDWNGDEVSSGVRLIGFKE